MASLGSHAQRLEEDLNDGDCASSEVRILARSAEQRLLVLLDEGGVELALLELVDCQSAPQKLDVSGETDHMVVLQSHIQ